MNQPLTPPTAVPGTDGLDGSGKIFVLGDSRTGTFALHNFFVQNGMKSVHYYMDEAGQKSPLHDYPIENERNFLEFIDRSPVRCFTDYPTRFYFRQLAGRFPAAYFILTLRDTTERWQRSMVDFFAKFSQKIDIDEATRNYLHLNEQIRTCFGSRGSKFLEICIDDDTTANTAKLAEFLEIQTVEPLARHNATTAIDNEILSKQHQIFPFFGEQTVEAIERAVAPTKAFLSEYGWVFLANDTNDFLKVQFGQKRWSDEDRVAAAGCIRARVDALRDAGIVYKKFIVPEKSAVYQEYLPRALQRVEPVPHRPAHLLEADCKGDVFYLQNYLRDARSYGQLYFRGDSHTNWTGAWFVYLYIVRHLVTKGLVPQKEIIKFADLLPTVAAYEGDLTVKLDPHLRKEFDDRWAATTARYGFEVTTKLEISGEARLAHRVDVPARYAEWFPSRETVAYERSDGLGPRAVVFRDSTLDFCHELLAQHFSRSVFVWHQGLVYENILREEKPDLVLHVMAERFVVRYPEFPPIIPAA